MPKKIYKKGILNLGNWQPEEKPIDILPCPFCGNKAKMYATSNLTYWITCENCGAQSRFMFSAEAAEMLWNARVRNETKNEV